MIEWFTHPLVHVQCAELTDMNAKLYDFRVNPNALNNVQKNLKQNKKYYDHLTDDQVREILSIRGFRTDDTIYEACTDLRERLPRGLSYILWNKSDQYNESNKPIVPVIKGLRKFTGREDEGQQQDTIKFFTQDKTTADSVYVLDKINGEAFHLSAVRHPSDDRIYIVCGSKNVHVVLDESLEPQCELRTPHIKRIIQALNQLNQTVCIRDLAIDLADRHITICGEIIDHSSQHVVDYSEFPDLTLVCFAIVNNMVDNMVDNICLNPSESIEYFLKHGLQVPSMRKFDPNSPEFNTYMEDIFNQETCEGVVAYYVHNNQTIGLEKYKSKHYVVLRAIREKLCNLANLLNNADRSKSFDSFRKSVVKRFDGLRNQVNLTNPECQRWLEMADRMILVVIMIHMKELDWLDQTNMSNQLRTRFVDFVKRVDKWRMSTDLNPEIVRQMIDQRMMTINKNKIMPIYGGIFLDQESRKIIDQIVDRLIGPERTEYSNIYTDHCTLGYFVKGQDPMIREWVHGHLNQTVNIQCTELINDSKCIGVRVRLPDHVPCSNTDPHVTIATITGTKPVYTNNIMKEARLANETHDSNELDELSKVRVQPIDQIVTGIVAFDPDYMRQNEQTVESK